MYGDRYDSGECTAAPGVGGSSSCNCSGCRGGYEAMATPSSRAHDPIKAYWEMATSTMRTPRTATYDERTVRVSYLFIKHQTEKAILFAMQDSNGVYQQWVPKAVITAMSEGVIMVKENFYRRNMQ
jgi:hypothetical protein